MHYHSPSLFVFLLFLERWSTLGVWGFLVFILMTIFSLQELFMSDEIQCEKLNSCVH